MSTPRPTPETDAKASPHIGFYSCATVPADFARRLERERDEARDQVQAMREAIREAHTELSTLLDTINNSRGVDGWHLNGDIATWDEFEINPAATITKLQPFIKLTHTPHEQQGQQQTQHDVWLREKLKAMVKPIKEAYNPFPDKPFIL